MNLCPNKLISLSLSLSLYCKKRAVRIPALRPYLSHSTPLFKSLKILKLEDLYITQLYKMYYKNMKNLLPSDFRSFTLQINDGHNYDLRHNILQTDKINHWTMFKQLILRNVPRILIRILCFWYRSQELCILWETRGPLFYYFKWCSPRWNIIS